MGLRRKFAELPTLSAADSSGHEAFPEDEPGARLDFNPRCLPQTRICEWNDRLQKELQFRAGLHKDVVPLNRRAAFRGMNLRRRLLCKQDAGSAFDANRALHL